MLSLPWEGTPSLKGGAALGVLASSIPQQGERSSLPGPALGGHAGPKKPPDTQPNIALLAFLVVDKGCWPEGGRLRGSGYVGATGPAKLVLAARLVCGCLWVLFLVE